MQVNPWMTFSWFRFCFRDSLRKILKKKPKKRAAFQNSGLTKNTVHFHCLTNFASSAPLAPMDCCDLQEVAPQPVVSGAGESGESQSTVITIVLQDENNTDEAPIRFEVEAQEGMALLAEQKLGGGQEKVSF